MSRVDNDEEDWTHSSKRYDGMNAGSSWRDAVTKDSGDHRQYPTGMRRDRGEKKPRFDLLIPEGQSYDELLLTRIAALLMRGAEKYSERNWELASTKEELNDFRESAFRHLIQWLAGETDEDHAAAVVFNVIGAEYVKGRVDR